MFSIWTLIGITLGYMLFLFILATIGNRAKKLPSSVYSLALGIHCTSWAFFGTTTQAAQFGWPLVPTYLGVILVMLFGYKMLIRVNTICKQYNISSIAEFISVRYNHSNSIAVLVTLICFIGVIPYIALQLDAITLALNLLIIDLDDWSSSISLYATMGMALFAIWFGARKMSLTERNSGLMLTIAAQSIVKLLALLIVGLFVVYSVFDGFVDLVESSLAYTPTREIIDKPFALLIYISHVLLGICSMFCLPRQFHVNFVENRNEEEIRQARWLFPAYLIGISFFVLPIAIGGTLFFGATENSASTYSTDSFVLAIPIAMNNIYIVVIAFVGGLAASSSMIIVATLALGNMVANSLITPLLLALNAAKMKKKIATISSVQKDIRAFKLSGEQVLRIRQFTIVIMLFIAYTYHLNVIQQTPLVQTGTIALSLLSQTFPAILLGIYWRRANRIGALAGILSGVSTIVVGMLLPVISNESISDLNDQKIAFVLFASFSINIIVLIAVSLFTQDKVVNPYSSSALNSLNANIRFSDLLKLTDQILPPNIAREFKDQVVFVGIKEDEIVPFTVLSKAENLLASHMGSASTRILFSAIAYAPSEDNNQLSGLVEEAGKNFQFNYEVLQASITHLPLGVSVIDANLKLVAWNQIYESIFDYPKGYLQLGKPIVDILKFNAQRGLLGNKALGNNVQDEIHKRMQSMLMGKSYKTVRPQLHGIVVEITGNALPAGGYITCYTDITEYIHIQNQLETAKTNLEKRVEQRTHELQLAKTDAEQANIGKTKFLAATSHDLMQPLNAASLFASMLKEKLTLQANKHSLTNNESELADNVISSLDNAESILNMLIDITKLENKLIKPNLQSVKLDDLLSQLVTEFSVMASQKSIDIRYSRTSLWVNTDRRLLSRVIQNLLSNAVKYTQSGKILIGVRRRSKEYCELLVADTGSGIAQEFQDQVFNEFQRVHPNDTHQGLGLGLTIVEKIGQLLAFKINLQSTLTRGSIFSIQLPLSIQIHQSPLQNKIETLDETAQFLANKRILMLENDPAVAQALSTLISSWGATVRSASNKSEALNTISTDHFSPDLIVADYHLDNGDNGIDAAKAVQDILHQSIITIVSSADRSDSLQALAYENNMQYLPKPIKQAALKRLLQKLLK
jgi:Na+/proline symporter/signal transduction histidine kinase/CheY-like chemotaxis protein